MKNILRSLTPFALFLLFGSTSFAQGVKQYRLVEHFTNTYCSLCPGGNSNLYSILDTNTEDVHHIAYHPSVPYSQCSFYQANTADNGARESYYGIGATPQAYLQGTRSGVGGNMMTQGKLDAYNDSASALSLTVTETDLGNNMVRIDVGIQAYLNVPSGNYRLFVAMVEGEVSFNAPNGESEHHDVFRKMLPDNSGEFLVPPAIGQQAGFSYTLTYDPSWHIPQMYAVAFVQEIDSKKIINSGTKFDPIPTSLNKGIPGLSMAIFPNPGHDKVRVSLTGDTPQDLEMQLLDLQGRAISDSRSIQDQNEWDLSELAAGMYVLQLRSSEGMINRKFIKQ